MTVPAISSISEPTYQNIQNNQPVKLTLCERVSQIFSRLYERISNFFSRKPNQIKTLEEVEPIYDVPRNNRPVKTLILYERISSFFSRGPSQIKLLEERINRENAALRETNQKLERYICVNVRRINQLEAYIHALKDMVNSKEVQIHALEEAVFSPKDDFCSHSQISRSDSGFSESPSPPIKKKRGLFFKNKPALETKIG